MFGFQQQVMMDSGPVIQNLTVDIYTAGTTTSDTSSTVTTSMYNEYYRYSVLHVLVRASEVNADVAGAKIITGIQTEGASTTGTRTLEDWRVYVAHTSETFLSSLMETDLSQSSSFTFSDRIITFDGDKSGISSGWNTLDFTTNFEYDGSSNLVLSFEKRLGTFDTASARYKTIYGSRGLSFRAALYNSDSTGSGDFPQSSSSMITTASGTANNNFPNLKINY